MERQTGSYLIDFTQKHATKIMQVTEGMKISSLFFLFPN